jgi:hypothetical protein
MFTEYKLDSRTCVVSRLGTNAFSGVRLPRSPFVTDEQTPQWYLLDAEFAFELMHRKAHPRRGTLVH